MSRKKYREKCAQVGRSKALTLKRGSDKDTVILRIGSVMAERLTAKHGPLINQKKLLVNANSVRIDKSCRKDGVKG